MNLYTMKQIKTGLILTIYAENWDSAYNVAFDFLTKNNPNQDYSSGLGVEFMTEICLDQSKVIHVTGNLLG